MTAALQLDLFQPRHVLPFSRQHPHNELALDDATCHIERHRLSAKCSIEIKIGRTAAGYHSCYGYQYSEGGYGGPLFPRVSHRTFEDARVSVIHDLTSFALSRPSDATPAFAEFRRLLLAAIGRLIAFDWRNQ